MCSLWWDFGCGSFIKMLTRPYGQWMHCLSSLCRTVFPFLLFSLSQSLSLMLSLSPLHLCLHVLKYPPALEIANLKNMNSFLILPFFLMPFGLLLCSAVSALFWFNLNTLGQNTFQLCMNQAAVNWIMLKHAAITDYYSVCGYVRGSAWISCIRLVFKGYSAALLHIKIRKLSVLCCCCCCCFKWTEFFWTGHKASWEFLQKNVILYDLMVTS